MSISRPTLAIASLGAASLLALQLANAADPDRLAELKATLLERYPTAGIVDVRPAAAPNLFEVFAGTQLVYTDAKGDFLIMGPLYETRSKRDLTAERLAERTRIDFRKLPFDRAIKLVSGKGTREIAVFSDPDCPYCRQLEKDLAAVPDLTVFVFPFPLESLHPGSTARARAIWCSADRGKAWRQWLIDQVEPTPQAKCAPDPIDELQAYGKGLYINSTPTLYDVSGRRILGAPNREQLEALLQPPAATPSAAAR